MQTEVLYGNGLRTSYTYDERSQLTGMDATTPLKVMETSYTYDSMERLTKESLNGAVTSYGYDLAGNRITKSTDGRTEKYFYNNRNQLTELHREKDVVRYSYDPAGNLTEENYHTADGASTKKLHYAYDVYNRNVSVTGDDFTQKNHYDAEGYRDSITEQDKVTNFVYQGGMLLHELDEDKNPARHYVLGNEYIGLDHNYYLTDEQGSVRYVLDAAGNVQNDYRYDAFGQCIAGQENIPNRLRYNAQIEDDLTGLYYLRARYYNTGIGRFTQEDVIYNDGLNLYAYCSSNPVMYSDPSGFAKKPCKSKVGGECGSESGSKTVNPNALKYNGDGTWTSNEGLIYGQGSIHGNRVKHVIAHTQPDPSKPTHTMYNVDKSQVIGLIDEAWVNKGQGIMQRNGNVKYEIDMGRVVGANGETSIRIITNGYSNNIVTAFPVQ